MTITLADAAKNTQDAIALNVIDEFRKSSYLLDNLTFDDSVSPNGGGSTLTYGYTRLITERSASFRTLNSEYTPGQAARQRYTVDLKPLGGAFTVDRVLANLGPAATNEVSFQLGQLIKSTRTKFQQEVILGDSATDTAGFDGLNKALTGSSTEYDPLDNGVAAGYVDWTVVDTQAEALAAIRQIDDWLSLMDDTPTAILGNRKTLSWFKTIASWVNQIDRDSNDSFGRPVTRYNGIPLVDLGARVASNSPIIPIYSADADEGGAGGTITGLTDLYAVRFGLDGFHAVSTVGELIKQWLPDFTTTGAVKSGEVELGPAATVLKATKAAATFRKIKVQ